MRKPSRTTAIKDCKVIWKLVLDGAAKNKHEALDLLPKTFLSKYEAFKPDFESGTCPLCLYADYKNKHMRACSACPYQQRYGYNCVATGCNFNDDPKEFASKILALPDK